MHSKILDFLDIFYFFLLRGGEGGVRGAGGVGGGGRYFIENPRRGVLPGRMGAGGRGAGRVFAGNLWGRGGLNIFFRGRNSHQEMVTDRHKLFHIYLRGYRYRLKRFQN